MTSESVVSASLNRSGGDFVASPGQTHANEGNMRPEAEHQLNPTYPNLGVVMTAVEGGTDPDCPLFGFRCPEIWESPARPVLWRALLHGLHRRLPGKKCRGTTHALPCGMKVEPFVDMVQEPNQVAPV
jgi:hypothetical protein